MWASMLLGSCLVFGGQLPEGGAPRAKQENLPTAEEILAGFRQNQAMFRNLRVIWRREHLPASGYFKNAAYETALVERDLQGTQLTPDQRKHWENKLKWLKQCRPEFSDYSSERLYQDFRTDWHSFQMRCPRQFTPFAKPPEGFRFPEEPLTEETLASTFADFRILVYDPATRSYTAWDGLGPDGKGTGKRSGTMVDEPWYAFPPLGTRETAADDVFKFRRKKCLIDQFFSGSAEEYEVIAAEEAGGTASGPGRFVTVRRTVYKNRQQHSFIPIEYHAEFRDRKVELHTVAIATIDCSRGYLPVRIRYQSHYVVDGKHLLGPGRTLAEEPEDAGLHVTEIIKVDEGGWYPTRLEVRSYTVDLEDYRGGQLRECIAGTAKPSRCVLAFVTTTTVERVQSGFGVADDPSKLPLPQGTLLLDATQGGVSVLGNPQDALEALAASVHDAQTASRWSWIGWAALLTANMTAALLLIWVWRRRRRLGAM